MNEILGRLKVPAIGLLITGVLSGALGFLTIISGLLRLAGALGKEQPIRDDAERLGYYFGTGLGYGIGVLSLLLAPVIIVGAVKMMKGQSRGLAMAAALFSLVPITCCSVPLGTIFGIWALVVLMNPDVKAYFAGEYRPSAPQNWQ
jgi:hypothetical protein